MKHHRYSFFGQKTAVLLDSADWEDPFLFFRFLKKLGQKRWEKPTLKEGKIIKINLLELIAILRVCHAAGSMKYETFHKFQGNNTQIKFEKKSEGQLVIAISGYQKYLNTDETVLLTKLLDHLLEEKIIHATGIKDSMKQQKTAGTDTPKKNSSPPRSISPPVSQPIVEENQHSPLISTTSQAPKDAGIDPVQWFAALQQEKDCKLVPGEVLARSERAVSFQVGQFQPIWVPLSCLGPDSQNENGLWVKEWFLRKKLDDIFPKVA